MLNFKEKIRQVQDFPKPGICFIDITTLLKDGNAFHQAINELAARFRDVSVDVIVGPEARGFVVGTPLAYVMKAGFVPVRKPGKLPAETIRFEYDLEYGADVLEMHRDAIQPGQKVLLIDDLLATGGTSLATVQMIEELGGEIVGLGYLVELKELQGREKLSQYRIESIVQY